MSLAPHGYSLRPRGGGYGSSSPVQPPPVSPTKRKKDESFSDDDEVAGDKLDEFHKVQISTTKSDTNMEKTQPQTTHRTKRREQHHHTETQNAYSYAPGSWGYITSKGGRKENQDFYIVPPDEAVDMANPNTALLFGVFDGHGIKGLDAARESGRDINNYFARNNHTSVPAPTGGKTQEWVDLTLRDAFRHAQDILLQIEAKNKQVLDYGTTACVAVIRPSQNEMTLAWLGDARAAVVRWEHVVSTPRLSTDDSDSGSSFGSFLGNNFGLPSSVDSKEGEDDDTKEYGEDEDEEREREGEGLEEQEEEEEEERKHVKSPILTDSPESPASSTTTVDDTGSGCNSGIQPTLQVVELTKDHVPEREDERERVLRQGGVIRRVAGVVRVVAGGTFTEEQLKQQRLALNITRSLGHAILSQYGISSEPDVIRTTIQPDDILIIASDGLWNELSSSEISSIALECKMAGFSPQKFCNMLLRRAEVVAKLKGILSDNITVVVYHHH